MLAASGPDPGKTAHSEAEMEPNPLSNNTNDTRGPFTDKARLDWLSRVMVNAAVELDFDGTHHTVTWQLAARAAAIDSADGLRAAIDAAMARERETGRG